MSATFIYAGEFRTFDRCFPNHVANLGQPNKIRWEDTPFAEFDVHIDDSCKAPECYPQNVLRMWERRLLTNVDGNYDKGIICLLRPDIVIDRKVDLTTLEIDDNTVYIPSAGDYRDGINDQMAIGEARAIKLYCNLFNDWQGYYNEGVLFHAETMLKHHLKVTGVEVKRLNTEVKIIREWM